MDDPRSSVDHLSIGLKGEGGYESRQENRFDN